ncbi:DUF397 domain-containing protein [Streptomyces sp. DSM 44917]|uniref:DUF397 domain-containing protein n=1 Tax=Streptomyces boetiae TaxID=3075541 RepID=A0ABU2L210_9ACTN|nr:DUF397 domain-containing protein [Streptomyces sp. DSM 44917]MDT0305383.1 DUF397 domain-containing protein [Streptomyces sp. DSM 44917]
MTDLRWQKSSYSMQELENNCVELSRDAEHLLLRESDTPDVVAVTTPTRLAALLRASKAGAFDRLG